METFNTARDPVRPAAPRPPFLRPGQAALIAGIAAVLIIVWVFAAQALSPSPAVVDPRALSDAHRLDPASPETALVTLPAQAARLRAEAGHASEAALLPAFAPTMARVRELIQRARQEGDPRWLGMAEAALARWRGAPAPPDEVLLLRATLLQSRHDFEGALRDLAALLNRDPANAQAWLTRASVERVMGRYSDAVRSCTRLWSLRRDLIAEACLADARQLVGSDSAYRYLQSRAGALAEAPSDDSSAWVLTVLAEMAERAGDPAAAQEYFRRSLTLASDLYTQVALADLLLAIGQPMSAWQVLESAPPSDAVLLRRARAAQQAALPGARALHLQIEERLAANRARGDDSHGREQAWFALHLAKNPVQAVELAERNWQRQREPADALLLAQAARASGRNDLLAVLRDTVRTNGPHDARLARLMEPQ